MASTAGPVFPVTILAGASVPGFRLGLRVPAATWTSVAWHRAGKRCCCQMLPAVRRTGLRVPQGLPVHRTLVVPRVRRREPVARWEQAGRVRRAPLPLVCRRTMTAQPDFLHRDVVPDADHLFGCSRQKACHRVGWVEEFSTHGPCAGSGNGWRGGWLGCGGLPGSRR